jgi:hypothetical protein
MYPHRRMVIQTLRRGLPPTVGVAMLALLLTLAVVGCGGGGGQPQQGEAAEQGESNPQPQQEEAKAREFPPYGDLRPGEYVTDEFEPAFSFEIVDAGWVVGGSEERTLVQINQGVAGPLVGFVIAEQVFNPNKVRELDSMPAPEDMVAWLEQHPYLKTDDPRPAAVGGVEGVRLDAVVASVPATECGGNCLGLFTVADGDYDWVVFEKENLRFIVLEDVGGERVTIVVEAPAEDFEEFLPKAQTVMDTVEWKGE